MPFHCCAGYAALEGSSDVWREWLTGGAWKGLWFTPGELCGLPLAWRCMPGASMCGGVGDVCDCVDMFMRLFGLVDDRVGSRELAVENWLRSWNSAGSFNG